MDGSVLKEIEITQQAECRNPPSNSALDVINGLTVLVFSPVIIPTQINNAGSEASRVLSKAMQKLLNRADQEITRSMPQLKRYARAGVTGTRSQMTIPSEVLPLTPESKYDPLLDAVVVVTIRNRQGSGSLRD